MKIKIISDGTPRGTRVVDRATGEPIERVASISWVITASGHAAASIIIDDPEVDLEVETEAPSRG